uniref:Aldo_ket_red domain-containing protein n=1 Tax=Panagrellus redivivus TaxID=6233 RepID=A0A7E4V2G1_PANRE
MSELDRNGLEYCRKKLDVVSVGTFRIKAKKTINDVVKSALALGYRTIDTAQCYRNEHHIGEALEQYIAESGSNLQREDVFITSKISPSNLGREKTLNSVKQSLIDLKLAYIDLMLIHWPGAQGLLTSDERNSVLREESWRSLEECYKRGEVKAIGVSNYTVDHLNELFTYATVLPAVNQIELHPHYRNEAVVKLCRKHGIIVQAYSSLGTTDNCNLLDDPKVLALAQSKNATPAQILLAWGTSQNFYVIPKTTNPTHLQENLSSTRLLLTNNEIQMLNSENENKLCWDPTSVV